MNNTHTPGKQPKDAWTKVAATVFDTHKATLDEIPDASADNILIAWPPILSFLKKNLFHKDNTLLRILDYGCGTGGFAQELHKKFRAHITGIDYAKGMIDIAEKHASSDIIFIIGDHTALDQHAQYDVITSIMSLPFIPDIEQIFQTFSQSVNDGALFIFAVFNPAWVKACLKKKILFVDFDSKDHPFAGKMQLAENMVPVFIRSSSEYEKLAGANGFVKLFEAYPEFTLDFLTRYPYTQIPTDIPEFLILGFRKL